MHYTTDRVHSNTQCKSHCYICKVNTSTLIVLDYSSVTIHVCRAEKLQVISIHQYNDSLDLFERGPYSVLLAPAKDGTGLSIQLVEVKAHERI